MLARWNIGGVQPVSVGGRYQVRSGLDATLSQVRSRGLQLSAIGVLRDADDSAKSALESVAGALRSLGLPAPNSQGSFVQGLPSVGIFILPDGENPGRNRRSLLGLGRRHPRSSVLDLLSGMPPRFNGTGIKKLRQDFGSRLPGSTAGALCPSWGRGAQRLLAIRTSSVRSSEGIRRPIGRHLTHTTPYPLDAATRRV